jgi:hypothetical protein
MCPAHDRCHWWPGRPSPDILRARLDGTLSGPKSRKIVRKVERAPVVATVPTSAGPTRPGDDARRLPEISAPARQISMSSSVLPGGRRARLGTAKHRRPPETAGPGRMTPERRTSGSILSPTVTRELVTSIHPYSSVHRFVTASFLLVTALCSWHGCAPGRHCRASSGEGARPAPSRHGCDYCPRAHGFL